MYEGISDLKQKLNEHGYVNTEIGATGWLIVDIWGAVFDELKNELEAILQERIAELKLEIENNVPEVYENWWSIEYRVDGKYSLSASVQWNETVNVKSNGLKWDSDE